MKKLLLLCLALLLPTQVFAQAVLHGFNTGVVPVVQNAAYAAGQSLGGLQTITLGGTPNVSGVLQQIGVESKGGSVVASDVYIWDANPVNTTCTDKVNFVVSTPDNLHLVVSKSITPALIAGAQDTHTYGFASSLNAPFHISGTVQTLWVCALAHGAVTPGSTSDLRFQLQGYTDLP